MGTRATIRLPDPTPKQRELAAILAGDPTYVLAYGGARSGKSAGFASYLIRHALTYNNGWALVLRKTDEDARKTIWEQTIVPLCQPLERAGLCRIGRSPRQIQFANGFRIVTGGAAPGELDKALGAEYDIIWPNECSEIIWPAIDALKSRLNPVGRDGQGRKPRPKMILDCNPPQKTHWTYKVFRLKQDPSSGGPLPDAHQYASLKFTPWDNQSNLDDGYIGRLQGMSGRSRVRFLDGEWGSAEGQVFPEFDPDRHVGLTTGPGAVPTTAPKGTRAYRGVDYGYVHPTACLWGYIDQSDRLVIYREYRESSVTSDVAAGAIIRASALDLGGLPATMHQHEMGVATARRYAATVSDHQAEYRHAFERAGLVTTPANKSVQESIDAIKRLFDRGGLIISHACPRLIEELTSYQWEPIRSSDQVKPTPKKEVDDLVDCLRYIVNELFAPKQAKVLY